MSAARRRPWPWIAAIAIVAIVAVAALLVLGGSDRSEVILEPTAATGSDPFTESVATERVTLTGGEFEQVQGGTEAVESLSGATPELYGGTGEEAVCDAEALVTFLEENPNKREAFATAVGVPPGEVAGYVSGLTPLLLREDTRVTNHGFEGGEATPFEAVLQAGTAVLVDDRGVPRVRCACGNPLAEPTATSSSPEFSGEAWAGFDEQRLVAVSASERPVEGFRVVNVETGEVYERGVGTEGNPCRRFASDLIPGSDGQTCSAEGFVCALTDESAQSLRSCDEVYAEAEESEPQGEATDCTVVDPGVGEEFTVDLEGDVDCEEATRILEEFYSEPRATAEIEGWTCGRPGSGTAGISVSCGQNGATIFARFRDS